MIGVLQLELDERGAQAMLASDNWRKDPNLPMTFRATVDIHRLLVEGMILILAISNHNILLLSLLDLLQLLCSDYTTRPTPSHWSIHSPKLMIQH